MKMLVKVGEEIWTIEELVRELYLTALSLARQGSGNPMTDRWWHMCISAYEDADLFLPLVAELLDEPDPRVET